MMKYIFNNNKADNYFNDLFKKYFATSPFYGSEKKKYTLKDEFKPTFFTYIKEEPKRKSPLFSADYTPSSSDLASLWNTFVPKLDTYYHLTKEPSYDFYINDTPVKIHGNYIQVGATLIPKSAGSDFFSAFSNDTKVTVYNVITEVNNIIII